MKRRSSFVLLFSLILTLPGCGFLHSRMQDKQHAVWVHRWDFKTADDINEIIQHSAQSGFDTVFFQVRGNGTVLYPSRFEPWFEDFGFQSPGFDPLQVACAAAQREGISIHAWVNALPGWRGGKAPSDPRQLYQRKPEWFLYDQDGKRQSLKDGAYLALNPCLPEVRSHIANICAEIAANYPVDGIHLDYIRFLEKEEGRDYPHDERSHAIFRKEKGQEPGADPAVWQAWKTEQVGRLVQECRRAIRAAKRDCQLSAAVFNLDAAPSVHQDWKTWVNRGWVDAVFPMLYTDDNNLLLEQLTQLKAAVPQDKVMPVLGVYKHKTAAKTLRQIDIADDVGFTSLGFYSYNSFYPTAAADAAIDADLKLERRREIVPALLSRKVFGNKGSR